MNILDSVKNLTKDNGAVKSLRDLLVLTNFVDESLEQFFTFVQNVQNGQKLGWTGEMEDVFRTFGLVLLSIFATPY